MDQRLLRQLESQCLQDNPPGCTLGCPVHVDVRGIVRAVQKEDYVGGAALFHRMIPFPGIISSVCDEPCRQSCRLGECGEPLAIRALEKFCVERAPVTGPPVRLKEKNQRVAVIGGGLSGATAAFELACKGYQVTLFEATAVLGGRLKNFSEVTLPPTLLQQELAVLATVQVQLCCNRPVQAIEDVAAAFDAVYVADGSGTLIGLDEIEAQTLFAGREKVFAGGSSRRQEQSYSPIASLADGQRAAVSIDRFLQQASLTANREEKKGAGSIARRDEQATESRKAVVPTGQNGVYTQEEAGKEAERCSLCECLACVKSCEFLTHYKQMPKRYIREIYNNLSIVMGIHRANKMINSCNLCGLCGRVCPGELDIGEVCREARRIMVQKGKMPPSAHDFALRDMRFSNSGLCSLTRHQPGRSASRYAFFPGCQLAASSPSQVQKMYAFLCGKLSSGVGLMLGCCGAPADWAGQIPLFEETLENILHNWKSLGSPQLITACPTCYHFLQDRMPLNAVKDLWTMLDEVGAPEPTKPYSLRLAVHDSCMTRQEAAMQDSVRRLAQALGCQLEELPYSRDKTTCCGYGGLMMYANRELADKVVWRRINESKSDYLTYCAMCRDNFAGRGKRAYHLLDLFFDDAAAAERRPPGYSQRQANRSRLKRELLREVWGEPGNEPQEENTLIIPDSVRDAMEDKMILESDIAAVIDYAAKSGNCFQNEGKNCYIAYFQPDQVTYWVEYLPRDNAFLILNAYCHRLTIDG